MSEHWAFPDYDEDALIEGLEPDQLAEVTAQPLEPARFGPRATAGVWALRAFSLLIAAMVLYTFVYATVNGAG